jgi:uncharacterized membrane protein YciS (DUF1049 family)
VTTRRRRWVILVAVILGLVGALAVTDAWTRRQTEQRISSQLAVLFGTGQPVHVQVQDIPFLPDLLRNRLGTGRAEAQDVTLNWQGRQVTLQQVTIDVHGLSPLRDPQQGVIDRLEGRVQVGYPVISELTGAQVSFLGDGRIRVRAQVTILDTTLPAVVDAGVAVDSGGQLSLLSPQAQVGGVPVPNSLLSSVLGSLQSRLVLPALPSSLTYSGVAVLPDGIQLGIAGTGVEVSKLR